MQHKQGGKQKQRKQFHKQQKKRSQLENEEIEAIERALEEGAPPRGSNPLSLPPAAAQGQQSGEGGAPSNYAIAKHFDELPISEYSKQGLREAKYVTLTAVQRAALPHALCGRDVLGAAKTGSGVRPVPISAAKTCAVCHDDRKGQGSWHTWGAA
jgi:ATP-dependent RNA helicase DDX10/DBP4